jgi:hypothetical protein
MAPVGISAAIEHSRAAASTFSRSLFDEDRWDADRVSGFVNERRNATIASVNRDDRPHAAVVIAASSADEIYFTVHPQSVLARNIGGNDRIALSVCDTRHAIMAQGSAVRVGNALQLGALIATLAQATTSRNFTPEGWDGDVYRIELRTLVAS